MSAVLRRLRERTALLSIRVGGTSRPHPSAVLEVDGEGGSIVVDVLNDTEAHRLVRAGVELAASAQLDGALVEFTVPVLEVEEADLPRYRLAFPSTMVYEQRREHFRVPVSELGLVLCLHQAKGRLMNVSPAGLGVWLEPPVHDRFHPGEILEGCRLELQGEPLHFDLEVRQLRTSRRREGLYLGGQIANIDPPDKRRLERFIAEVQRERVRKRV